MSSEKASALAPVYLLVGEDAALLGQRLTSLLEEVATDDGGLSPIEEHAAASRDDPLQLGPVLDACRTPPFLSPRRVVVARDAETLDAAATKLLAEYLADPVETTVLIVCVARERAPAALTKALPAGAIVLDTAPGRGTRGLNDWFASQIEQAPVRLGRDAVAALRDHLGEDLARLEGLLSTLEAAYGSGARIGLDELEPYLGSAGGVAPWDLTDAIDKSETRTALAALERMLGGGERHPLQILATLHRHYQAMLYLDGSGITDEKAAAGATKLSPFPAGKALREARRLGHEKIRRAIELLADADLDLRGRTGLPPELVMEVLVARLCQNARLARVPQRRRSAR